MDQTLKARKAGEDAACKAIQNRHGKAPLLPKRSDRTRWAHLWAEFLSGWKGVVAADRVAQTTWGQTYDPTLSGRDI